MGLSSQPVAEPDTGWRLIPPLFTFPAYRVRRIGRIVCVTDNDRGDFAADNPASDEGILPPGFLPPTAMVALARNDDATATNGIISVGIGGDMHTANPSNPGANPGPCWSLTYITNDPWPTVLPGTKAP